MMAPAPVSTAPPPAHVPWRPRAQPVRVLLAEDDEATRTLLAETLHEEGYAVTEVGSGLELRHHLEHALRKGGPRELPLELIVCDLRMPGVSGLDVLTWLRAQGVRTPAILITAFGDPATHAAARMLGAVAVLDKPFDLDGFLLTALLANELP